MSNAKFIPSSVRIFEEADGWHYCDNALPYLDARGKGYPSKAAALRAARFAWECSQVEGTRVYMQRIGEAQ